MYYNKISADEVPLKSRTHCVMKTTFFIYLSTVTNLSNKTNAQERYKISLTPLSRSLYQLYCESRRRKMQFLPILS